MDNGRDAKRVNWSSEPEPGWEWRNCRSVGLRVEFWPIDWHVGIDTGADRYGGETSLSFGPFALSLAYNDGSAAHPKDPHHAD